MTSMKEILESGQDPRAFTWGFNGIRPNGEKLALDPMDFIAFAQAYHPEWIDSEAGEILVMDFVLTKQDAELADDPTLEGTVAVTLRPDIDGNLLWSKAAQNAAARYPANKKVRELFLKLAESFKEEGMDKEFDV